MATFGQYLIYPFVSIFSKIFLRTVTFHGEENFKSVIGKPVIIIANHISSYDSFLLRLSQYWKYLHIHFMGVTSFESRKLQFLSRIGVITLAYKLFGVFTVVPGSGIEKNLEIPRAILTAGKGVFIFPEGYINRSQNLLPFKNGAARLATSTGAVVMPIAFKDVIDKGKIKVTITIGTPVSFAKDADVAQVTAQLQDMVKGLM